MGSHVVMSKYVHVSYIYSTLILCEMDTYLSKNIINFHQMTNLSVAKFTNASLKHTSCTQTICKAY